jgi:hypothetical protein
MPLSGEQQEQVLSSFLFLEMPGAFDPFSAWRERASPVSEIVSVFQSNLNSAVVVGSIPFSLVNNAAFEQRFSQILSSERIRSLIDVPPGAGLTSEHEKAAYTRAKSRMREIGTTDEFRQSIVEETLLRLRDSLASAEFSEAAAELLRQVTVMLWGALEVVSTDIAVTIANKKPDIASRIVETDLFKKSGFFKGVSIGILEEFKFDVSRSMGSILFDNRRLDSVSAISDVYDAMFENSQLNIKLKSPEIWELGQRRHLIVHRRSIVDRQYISKTSDNRAIGSSLSIVRADVDKYLKEVRDIGLFMAECAHDLLSQ